MTTTTAPTAATGHPLGRRLLAALVLAISLATTTVVAAPPPAEAATSTGRHVQFCFTHAGFGTPAADLPVQLQEYRNGQWVTVRNGRSGYNGCGKFWSVAPNRHTRVQLYVVIGSCNPTMYAFLGTARQVYTSAWGTYYTRGTVYGYALC